MQKDFERVDALAAQLDTEPEVNQDKVAESEGGSAASKLVALVRQRCELIHDEGRNAYALIENSGHRETLALWSKQFREWIGHLFYRETAKVAPTKAVDDAITTLTGQAIYDGKQEQVFVRVAQHGDSYWIDLGDDRWRAVQVTQYGWEVVSHPPVIFRRSNQAAALPEPVAGGDIGELVSMVNIDSDVLPLIVTWMVECFRPNTSFPILEIGGEQGSAKSTTQKRLRALIDPNNVSLRNAPERNRDLLIGAAQNWVVSYNNVSRIPKLMQDDYCSLSTGGGIAWRQLYSDMDEVVQEIQRPVVLNGIAPLATNHDMVDRTVRITLPTIPDEAKRSDPDLDREFEQAAPRLFGALLTVFSQALAELPRVHLERPPRMMDFALLGEAVCKVMHWPESFAAIYARVRREAVEVGLAESPFIEALRQYIARSDEYEGTPSDLLSRLEKPQHIGSAWPSSGQCAGNVLHRHAVALRQVGIQVEFLGHTKVGNPVRIYKVPETSSPSSPSTPASENHPRSPIQCGDCWHFERDTVGDGSGLGGCKLNLGHFYPFQKHICDGWKVKPTAISSAEEFMGGDNEPPPMHHVEIAITGEGVGNVGDEVFRDASADGGFEEREY